MPKVSHPLSIAVLLAVCLLWANADECNNTHMEFFSEYSLGKQDELNRTFTKVGERVKTLNNFTWTDKQSTFGGKYDIQNIKPTFHYLDSNQKASIQGNDSIAIYGGKVEVTIEFDWRATQPSQMSGTGRAIAVSDEIIFAKKLDVKNHTLYEDLINYENITFLERPFRKVIFS